MFNIGSGELAVIAIVALLILGPKRLPELARGIGKFVREFRRQTDEVRGVVEREFYRMDDDGSRRPAISPAAGGEERERALPLGHPNRDLPPGTPSAAPGSGSGSGSGSLQSEMELGDTYPRLEPVRSQLTSGMPDTGAPPTEKQ